MCGKDCENDCGSARVTATVRECENARVRVKVTAIRTSSCDPCTFMSSLQRYFPLRSKYFALAVLTFSKHSAGAEKHDRPISLDLREVVAPCINRHEFDECWKRES